MEKQTLKVKCIIEVEFDGSVDTYKDLSEAIENGSAKALRRYIGMSSVRDFDMKDSEVDEFIKKVIIKKI